MQPPPYSWRADGGYHPPEEHSPPAPAMFYTYPGAPAPYGFAPPPPPPACPGSFSFNYVLPPPAYCIVPPSPPPPAKKEEPKKKDPNANPADREGMNYLYPKHHATVHFIKEKKVWEKADTNFQVKIWTVPTVVSVRDIIEKLLGKEGEDCKGWALTEVNELGDGEFSKVCYICAPLLSVL